MLRQRMIVALMAALLASITIAPVEAARRDREAAEEVMFPNATRTVEKGSISRSQERAVGRLFDYYNEDGKEAEAIEAAKAIIANERATAFDRAIAYQIAGLSAYNTDDNAAAIEFIGKALAENTLDNNTHYQLMQQLAGAQYNEGRHDDAIVTITRLMQETATEKPEWYELLAGASFEAERFAEAASAIEKAISLSAEPKASWTQLQMAAYSELGDNDRAVAAAKALYEKTPDDKRALMTYAGMLINAERYSEAASLLDGARSKGLLTDERDYRTLISLYYNMDDQESQLVAVVEEGLTKGALPRDKDNLNLLAQSYYFAENLTKALEFYEQAAQLDTTGAIDLNYAKVLNEADRFAESKAAAMQAINEGVAKKGDAWIVVAAAESGLENDAGVTAAYREAAKFPETAQQAQQWLSRNAR